jgi:hypothetical protein
MAPDLDNIEDACDVPEEELSFEVRKEKSVYRYFVQSKILLPCSGPTVAIVIFCATHVCLLRPKKAGRRYDQVAEIDVANITGYNAAAEQTQQDENLAMQLLIAK